MWDRQGLLGALLSAVLAAAVALKANSGATVCAALACGTFLTTIPTSLFTASLPWMHPASVIEFLFSTVASLGFLIAAAGASHLFVGGSHDEGAELAILLNISLLEATRILYCFLRTRPACTQLFPVNLEVAAAVGSGFFVPLAVVNVSPVWRQVTYTGVDSVPFLRSSPTANALLFGLIVVVLNMFSLVATNLVFWSFLHNLTVAAKTCTIGGICICHALLTFLARLPWQQVLGSLETSIIFLIFAISLFHLVTLTRCRLLASAV
ncbi:putative transmembrane protein [Toxoplasma gondii VEG]|uniref:Putative transmembrane protein n=3 Tax=Toxoplasma gondii TaxID=5811 RepID=V4ZS39_TOXGV|nr:putative transmembrane protein [Toxoplasma gondii VEG]KFG52499.1 putative transmembrane protein [Toxoplasma gondii p89]PUA87683.1 putative transmembrane protein [Toxoplasma gondii TgCATBr9]CEL75480.1 TPA: hypothetical protein BN1205_015620 [Toxoplasma gondii VEG]